MRITFNTGFANTMAAINGAAERLAQLQREVATGKRLHVPSDDPSAAAVVVSELSQGRALDQYVRASDSVDSRLKVVDSVLSDIVRSITYAQTQGAAGRSTVLTQAQRDATALAIEGARDSIFSAITTAYGGVYLFSGAASTTPPYTKGATISAYLGDSTTVSVDISQTRSVAITLDGDAVLRGSDPSDVFAVLTNLARAVRSGNMAAIDQGMADLGRAFDRVVDVQSRVGADLAGLADERLRIDEARRASDARRSTLEDANLAESISGMNRADQALRAALAAMSNANRPSLLDFLR